MSIKGPEKAGEILLYQTDDGQTTLDVRLEAETVWLSLNQMADLFQRDKSVISRHMGNIFKTGELNRESTVAKFATVQQEGPRKVERRIDYYNLDAIISVGYRVNSIRGTQFRIWATHTLKDHLIYGYTLNERRLRERGLAEAEQAIRLLSRTLDRHELITAEGRDILAVITRYAKSWLLLKQYDDNQIKSLKKQYIVRHILDREKAERAIVSLKKRLMEKGEATPLFGQDNENRLVGILGAVQQSFDGKPLYPGIEEQAAHLLYFIIKDHPFVDGNKRIGSFLFIIFLQENKYLEKKDGTPKINDNAIVALSLLIAESEPSQKDLMVRLIMNLIVDDEDKPKENLPR
jgi:prophage maintenance system killer protein